MYFILIYHPDTLVGTCWLGLITSVLLCGERKKGKEKGRKEKGKQKSISRSLLEKRSPEGSFGLF